MAKQRLNKNVVGIVSVLVFLGMVAASVAMLYQLRQRDPAHFVELADRYRESGEWQQAALFYGRAYDRSRDPIHLVSLGEMWLNQGDVRRALESWRQALVQRPDLVEAHRRRIEMLTEYAREYGRLDDWKELQSAAEALIKSQTDLAEADAAFAHHANGLALVNLQGQDAANGERGLAALKKAVSLAPTNATYAVDLAVQTIRNGAAAEGETMLSGLITKFSAPGADAAEVRRTWARFLASRRKWDEALNAFEESAKLAGEDRDAKLESQVALAGFLTQQWGRAMVDPAKKADADAIFKRAESTLLASIDASPDSYDAYMQLAVLYQAAQRSEDALNVCKRRLDRPVSRKGIQGARNALDTFMLRIRASEACVAIGVDAERNKVPAERDGWLAQARQFVEDAKAEVPGHPRVRTQAARVFLAEGNYRAALLELRGADETYRTYSWIDWDNKKLLARVHLELNEPGAAKELLDAVLEDATRMLGDDVSFWALYATATLRTGAVDRAEALADRVLMLDPDNAEAKQVKLAALQQKGRRDEVVRLTGESPAAVLMEARERALAGDQDGALEVLRQALGKDPADVQLVTATVRELLDRKMDDDARQVADRAVAAKPDDATLKRIQLFVRKDITPEERDRSMLELIDAEPDAYKRQLDRVAYYSGKRHPDQALAALNEAEKHLVARDTPLAEVGTHSQHRALLFAKLRLAAELKDETAMAEARDSAAKFDVDGAGGKSVLGAYYMARNNVDAAIKALREAAELQPTDSRTLTLLGQCMQSAGAAEEAKTFYGRAVKVNPGEGLAWRGLAMVAKASSDMVAYEQALSRAETLVPSDAWVQSELLLRSEQADPRAAIAARERMLADNPSDINNLLRLAALWEQTGDQSKADGAYDKAIALMPDERDVVAAAGKYYRRTGRPERSLQIAQAFVNSRTTPEAKADAMILVASHSLGAGELAAVEKALLDAADVSVTFDVAQSLAEFYFRPANRAAEALPWFDKAVEIARARSMPQLPNVLAARVSCLLHRAVNQIDVARSQIEEFIRSYPADTRGMVLQSELYSRLGEIDKAIESLTTYLSRTPGDITILFQRAQLYIAQGRMALAIADLEQIKQINPLAMNLEPRVQLSRLHFRSGRRDLAVRELEQLVTQSNYAPRAVEELVEAYLRDNRVADAERSVTAQINRAAASPDARWHFLRGRVLLAQNENDKAMSDFLRGAELARYSPDAIARTLDAFVRTARYAEGVSFFEQHSGRDQRDLRLLATQALLLARSDHKPQAVEKFRQAMDLAKSDSPEAVRAVTERLVSAFDKPEAAIDLFRANPPTGSAGRANDRILVRLHRLAKQIDEASALLGRLIESATNDAERASLWYEKGEMYQVAGQAQPAREAYESSLKYGKANWVTLNNLAYLLADVLGENQKALVYAQQAVALADNPSTLSELHQALDTLGWIYVGLKQYPEAVSELTRAIRLRPDEPLTYYHLGEAYRRQQQYDQAREVLDTARRTAFNAQDSDLVSKVDASLEKCARRDGSD